MVISLYTFPLLGAKIVKYIYPLIRLFFLPLLPYTDHLLPIRLSVASLHTHLLYTKTLFTISPNSPLGLLGLGVCLNQLIEIMKIFKESRTQHHLFLPFLIFSQRDTLLILFYINLRPLEIFKYPVEKN